MRLQITTLYASGLPDVSFLFSCFFFFFLFFINYQTPRNIHAGDRVQRGEMSEFSSVDSGFGCINISKGQDGLSDEGEKGEERGGEYVYSWNTRVRACNYSLISKMFTTLDYIERIFYVCDICTCVYMRII
jgi:hypothetical protein